MEKREGMMRRMMRGELTGLEGGKATPETGVVRSRHFSNSV